MQGKPRALSAWPDTLWAELARVQDESEALQAQFGMIDGRLGTISAQLDAIQGQLAAIPAG